MKNLLSYTKNLSAPLLALVTLFTLTSPIFVSPSHPQFVGESQIDPGVVSPSTDNLFFGQKHTYTVVFRNDGKATVLGRIAFKNVEKDPVKEIKVSIPQVAREDSVFYQVSVPRQCEEYDYDKPVTGGEYPCLKYNDDALYSDSYYYGNEDYKKITPKVEEGIFTLPLVDEVKENAATAVVFAYRAKHYTTKTAWGSYRFTFATPSVPASIDTVNVAVDVDSDLTLKGKKSKVSYQDTSTSPIRASGELQSLSAPMIGKTFDYYQQRGFTKTGRNLASNESFVVRGEFADSWWKLYLPHIFLTILAIVAFIFGIKLWQRRHPQGNSQTPQPRSPFGGTMNLHNTLLAVAGAGGIAIFNYITQWLMTNMYSSGSFTESVYPLLTLLGAFIYLLLFVGPAVYAGVKRGWSHVAYVVVMQLIFLFAIIYILAVTQQGNGDGTIIYPVSTMMERAL